MLNSNYISNNIIQLIPCNNKDRITASEISMILSIDAPRVRREINLLRESSIPIASDNRGYWITNDPKEINKTIQSLMSRIKKMERAIGGMEKAIGRIDEIIA